MNCGEVKDQILEIFDWAEGTRAKTSEKLMDHLAGCVECARFASEQSALDAALAQALTPPEVPVGFRVGLRRHIRRERISRMLVSLPELAILASCIAVALLCVALLPMAVAGEAAAAMAAVYLLEMAVLSSLDEEEA